MLTDQHTRAELPVVIVGGGPVGLALAIELGQRGITCTLIERNSSAQRVPKGQNLTQRTMEHFRSWGIEDELRKSRTMSRDQPAAGLVTYASLRSGFVYPWLQRDRVGSFYAAANERLPQYETERVLRERVQKLSSVTVRNGWKAVSINQDDALVEVEILSDTGAREILTASWVIGCDGSRSVVRESSSITQTVSDRDRRMVLAVFRSPEFDALVSSLPAASFINVLHPDLQGYWQFFGRVDAAETWFFHAPVDEESTTETLDLRGILARAAGERFDFTVEHLGFWDLRFALADAYRDGRILIAGDAAHSHPPYGGYGINNGFEDAVNLGWKLAAVLEGWADAALLDSYDYERRSVFASLRDEFIARSIAVDRDFLSTYDPSIDERRFTTAWSQRERDAQDEVSRYEPNYEGSKIVVGADNEQPSALGDHQVAARAGHHLAPGEDSDGEALFDELNCGFTLLAAVGCDVTGFEDAAASVGMPLSIVRVTDTTATRYGADAVLVRPDQFIAWAGDPANELPESPKTIVRSSIGMSPERSRP